jgi:hypothetical protein
MIFDEQQSDNIIPNILKEFQRASRREVLFYTVSRSKSALEKYIEIWYNYLLQDFWRRRGSAN